MNVQMKRVEAIQYHKDQMLHHQRRLQELESKKKFVLTCAIPFEMYSNKPALCPRCRRVCHSFTLYRSNLTCSRCATDKHGHFKRIQQTEWRVVEA